MNTDSLRITRPMMLREYLCYMWSHPVARRLAFERAHVDNVTGAQLCPAEAGPAAGRSKGVSVRRAALILLLVIIWLVSFGAQTALAQGAQCPETNVVKYVQPPQ